MKCHVCNKNKKTYTLVFHNAHGGRETRRFCRTHSQEAMRDERYEIPAWAKMLWEKEWPPSIAAYMQRKAPRPTAHFVWHMPEGIDLQTALGRIRRGLCFCGKPRGRASYGCNPKHTSDFAKAVEYWGNVRWKVIQRQKRTCQLCGKDKLWNYPVVDHIIPIIDGGAPWDPANMQLLCRDCNDKKTGEDATKRAGIRKAIRTHVQTMRHRRNHPPLSAFS